MGMAVIRMGEQPGGNTPHSIDSACKNRPTNFSQEMESHNAHRLVCIASTILGKMQKCVLCKCVENDLEAGSCTKVRGVGGTLWCEQNFQNASDKKAFNMCDF